MNVSPDDIKRVKMELLQNKLDGVEAAGEALPIRLTSTFDEVQLPVGALPITSVAMNDDIPDEFIKVIEYLNTRGYTIADGWNYHWSPSTKWDLNKRIIIPFYYKNKVVGWTARYAGTPPHGTPRYFNSELQQGYMFNLDVINLHERKYILIVEGPFDAIAIDGIAVSGSELNKERLAWLSSSPAEKIIVPDRQRNNQGLIDAGVENGWSVSFPEWEEDIKDAAAASARYGKLFTLQTILKSRTKNQLQIGIQRRMFR
jgi:hypothetical protein